MQGVPVICFRHLKVRKCQILAGNGCLQASFEGKGKQGAVVAQTDFLLTARPSIAPRLHQRDLPYFVDHLLMGSCNCMGFVIPCRGVFSSLKLITETISRGKYFEQRVPETSYNRHADEKT